MADLSSDDFLGALQSDMIKLLVGQVEYEITISKDLLCMKSETMRMLVEKGGSNTSFPKFAPKLLLMITDVLALKNESITAVKMFVCWCYQVSLTKFTSSHAIANGPELLP